MSHITEDEKAVPILGRKPREPKHADLRRPYWFGDKKFYRKSGGTDVAVLDLTKGIDNIPEVIKYTPSIHTQGNTGAASRVKIVATKADGTPVARANHRLRVRAHNAGTITASTNATIAVVNATRLLDSLTSEKDLLIEEAGSASLTTAQGSNRDLTFTSLIGGSAGNSTTIAYVNPATVSAALSVAVTGTAITVNLATNAGTPQVETATVTAAAGATEAGVLTVVVTAAGVTGSPLSIPVALTTDDDTAAKVATAIRAALTANAALTAVYTVGGTSADATLTKIVAAANDATLNVAWGAYMAGIDAVASSTNTTPGVAPAISSTATNVKTAVEASAAASALVSVALASGSNGSGTVTALSPTALAGGSDYGDVFWIDVTNAEAESVVIETGPCPFGEFSVGDHFAKLTVAHAAP